MMICDINEIPNSNGLFTALGTVVGAALIYLFNAIKEHIKNRAPKPVETTRKKIDIAGLIDARLTEMRIKYDVSRLGVAEFSNGERTVNGFQFLFVTRTFEKTNPNVSSMTHLVNKVPASWYTAFFQHFTQPDATFGYFSDLGEVEIDNKKMPPVEDVANTLSGQSKKAMYYFKIGKDISDGLLSLSFLNSYQKLTPEQIASIKGDCHYIHKLMQQRPK
jgi:hypothetical protein